MIYSYQKVTDEFTTHVFTGTESIDGSENWKELATIDGVTYMHVPDQSTIPQQKKSLSMLKVTLTDGLRQTIKNASPRIRLINKRVVDLIRAEYSVDDELKMLRLAPSDESSRYNDFVEDCRAWGRAEKVKIGLG